MSDLKTIVVDNGTGFVKCGFAGDNFPRSTFPAMVGRPLLRAEEGISSKIIKDITCGDECAKQRASLQVSYPLSNGMVQNWTDMNHLWKHTFDDVLKVDPTECRILLTEPPLNPKQNREKMVKTMFETYGFQGMYVSIQAVLVLFARGLMTGVVLDSGDGVTHIIPVYDGYTINKAIERVNVAGRDITDYLIKLLAVRGYSLMRSADYDTARRIKEKLCYVAHDSVFEDRLAKETTYLLQTYDLPDKRKITIGRERWQAPEALFYPEMIGIESEGIHTLLFNCINKCSLDIRKDLYRHIVLSGGSTMYPGLPTRLEKEMKKMYLEKVLAGKKERLHKFNLKIEAPPTRKNIVFIGGAVLAEILGDRWISKADYEEQGMRVLG